MPKLVKDRYSAVIDSRTYGSEYCTDIGDKTKIKRNNDPCDSTLLPFSHKVLKSL